MQSTLAVYEQVAQRAKQYPYGVGREQIARDFGVGKSTAKFHLENCVRRGLLVKFYGWLTDRSRGWIYIDPEEAPEIPLTDEPEGDENVH